MAKLYFYYSAMNAGKSTVLLQSAHNYREQGMHVLVITSNMDDRYAVGQVASRIGLQAPAYTFHQEMDLYAFIIKKIKSKKVSCVLVDEAQFLSKDQVMQLARVVDTYKIPVLAYGLRTDFQGRLFAGSQQLLAIAEELIEIKTICCCGRKATMNARLDADGDMVIKGEQVEIGGNDRYESMCRRCFIAKKMTAKKEENTNA